MICTCTCAHACILMHTDMCKRVQQKNTRLQNNAKKFIHLCECVLAFLCVYVCVFLLARRNAWLCVRACMCVSPPFADCSCHPRKNLPAQQKAILLGFNKQQRNPHIHKVQQMCHKFIVLNKNSQIKSVFVPMRQCMHVWVCVRLSVFANFVAGNFHNKLLLTCVI